MNTQTLNITDQNYFDKFLKTLEKNTDRNYHTENCLLIAVNFGTERQKEEMKAIMKDHEKQGHLDYITSIARSYLIKDIINNISDKKLANKINSKL